MRYKEILMLPFIVVTVVLTAVSCKGANQTANKLSIDTAMKGFAVLELFTSEGCSSCPPADDLFARIQKEFSGEPVYLLAFHVDYWDRLGWKDIFSDKKFTERQGNYQTWLHTSNIYTPQLVVNGSAEFVGSNEQAVRRAISESLSKQVFTQILTQPEWIANQVTIKYELSRPPVKGRLLVAVIEKAATSRITRGENTGRTIAHVQIVRGWSASDIPAEGNGTVQLTLPPGFNKTGWDLIAMVQDGQTGKISAVNSVKF